MFHVILSLNLDRTIETNIKKNNENCLKKKTQ
jgi:hypothetical protein